MKSVIFDRVSKVVEAVEVEPESKEVADGVGKKKTVKFCEILPVVTLVVLISEFFPFLVI